MAKSLGDLIRDADEIITVKTASVKPQVQDDIFKLAGELVEDRAPALTEDDFSMAEKIAHSVALVETLINMPTLKKVAEFEKKAKEIEGHDICIQYNVRVDVASRTTNNLDQTSCIAGGRAGRPGGWAARDCDRVQRSDGTRSSAD